MIKKKAEELDKEEKISLKENKESKTKKNQMKELAKKKKLKKITLDNIDLGTNPINISSSKYQFLEYINLTPSMKIRIKIISILVVVFIVFIILFTLKGKFHHLFNDDENEIYDNNIINQQNITINNTKFSSPNISSTK